MKAIKNMLYIAAMATAITACTSEDALAPELNTPLTVSATIPGDVWAVASRSAEGEEPSVGSSSASRAPQYSAWTLHYTNYQGNAATYAPTVIVTMNEEVEASFTTGDDLVWAQIDATQPIHLTCVTDNGTDDTSDDYTLHVSVASPTPRQTLAFGAMKPTVAKFTVKFTLTTNSSETISIGFEAKGMAADYDPQTNDGAWPASDLESEYVIGFETLQVEQEEGSLVRTVTGTILLPEQEMNPIWSFGLGQAMPWRVDLSTVSVGSSEQKANQLKAGQHITLNITASYTTLNTPSIEVEAFTHGGSYDLGGEAQQPSTNS